MRSRTTASRPKQLLRAPCGFEGRPRAPSSIPLGLGVELAGELRRLGPTLESAFLKDRRHVGVRHEVSVALLVQVENHPDPALIVWIAKDVRTLAPVLLSLLRALCGERIPEAVEILDLRGRQNHLALLSSACLGSRSDPTPRRGHAASPRGLRGSVAQVRSYSDSPAASRASPSVRKNFHDVAFASR